MKLLLEHGADPKKKDVDGHTVAEVIAKHSRGTCGKLAELIREIGTAHPSKRQRIIDPADL